MSIMYLKYTIAKGAVIGEDESTTGVSNTLPSAKARRHTVLSRSSFCLGVGISKITGGHLL